MLTYLINVSLTWIILFVIYKSLLEREKYFKLNRFYLLSALVLGLLLPLVSYIPFEEVRALPLITSELNYSYQEQMVSIAEFSSSINSEIPITETSFTFSWILLLKLTYFFGLSIVAIRMMKSVAKLTTLFRKSMIVEMPTHSEIVVDDKILPFSFMKYIFINAQEYNSIDRSNILRHELYHVKALHSIDVLCIEVLKIIFWWHPMVYLYKRSIAENHEYAADEAVLVHSSRKQYCELLMKKTFPNVNLGLTNPFFQTFIKKRITMMYQTKTSKVNLLKYSTALFAIVFMAVIFTKPLKAQINKPVMIASVSGLEKYQPENKPLDISNVTVTQLGKKLKLNEDYQIEASTGKLKILDENIMQNGLPVKVEFKGDDTIEQTNAANISRIVGQDKEWKKSDCKLNKHGLFYGLDQDSRLPSCPKDEEGWLHGRKALSKFAKENFIWPSKAIEEGEERYMYFSLVIDEKGNLGEVLPHEYFDKRPYLHGLHEEGMRLIDLMRKEFKFIPGECNGKPVRTSTSFSLKLKIPEDKRHLVKIKNASNVVPNQRATITGASANGIGLTYYSNMNVAFSLEVENPEGEVVFTDSRDYMYSHYREGVQLIDQKNGKYILRVTQDGLVTETSMDITVFK